MNLLLNASQAIPEKGTISISTEQIEVPSDIAGANNVSAGSYIKIRVADTGTGMDDETKRKVFEPFFSKRHSGKGTGLGLSSVYGIVRNHGGFIQIESELNKGTSIYVYLPVTDKPPVYDETADEEISLGRHTILLIDDEEMILDVGEKMLRKIGYSVYSAISGIDAVEYIKNNKASFDAAIIDMIMPKMSGNETAKELRKLLPDIPILFSSGYSEEEKIHDIVSEMNGKFIQKPYTIQDLSKKLKEMLPN